MKHFHAQHILLAFIAFLMLSEDANGQSYRRRYKPTNYINNIKVIGGTGLATYFGDLCHSTRCWKMRPQLTGGISYRYNQGLVFRSEWGWYRLFSTDKGGKNENRNLHFRADNFEWTLTATYDLFKWNRVYIRRYDWTPYLMLGAGVTYFNPKAKLNGEWHKLRPLQTEGVSYNKFAFVLPYGGGVRYKLSPFVNISAEIAYRQTFTDYLDDVSTDYVNNNKLEGKAAILADRTAEGDYGVGDSNDGEHWAPGHKRGNPNKNDGYFMFSIKVDYTIKVTEQRGSINSFRKAKFQNMFFIK